MTDFTYHVKPIQILCQDKTLLAATLFSPTTNNPGGIVVICAAIGVGQAFYHEFARFLCEHQYCVITFDYRGTGDSQTPSSNDTLKLEDWAKQDINAVITHASTLQGSDHIFLTGHSIGGQLFCLAEQSKNLTGVILVAASFPHWKRWPFPRKWLMYFFFHILIRVLSVGRKHFPTKMLGIGKENLPVNLISDWGKWGRHPDYVTADKFNIDVSGFNTVQIPMLSFGFDDDTYAPKKAIHRLHNAFTTDIGEIHIATRHRDTGGIGHFGFFKKNKAIDLWGNTINWMNQKTSDFKK